jgi:acetolactate synthase I/II/III large subunit
VINSGIRASQFLRELVAETNFPITSTLMGLGAYPASGKNWLGMLGMHGLYEANLAMHGCDLMINIGARFDDRITGRVKDFSPHSRKAHIDIDPSSINKVIRVDVPIVGDVRWCWKKCCASGAPAGPRPTRAVWTSGGSRSTNGGRWTACPSRTATKTIKPQYALQRLEALTKGMDRYITTEVGQHQMWAAQFLGFEDPQPLDDLRGPRHHGLRPARLHRRADRPPDALVINVAGEASWLMNMQEMGTAMQFRAPVKQFILNNERLGMVRQWQELLHGERYSHSWSDALPDFVKLAEAFGCKGIKCSDPKDLDDAIMEMIRYDGPVIFDCLVEKHENCFPMIPSGKPHNEMLLGEADTQGVIGAKGAVLV